MVQAQTRQVGARHEAVVVVHGGRGLRQLLSQGLRGAEGRGGVGGGRVREGDGGMGRV